MILHSSDGVSYPCCTRITKFMSSHQLVMARLQRESVRCKSRHTSQAHFTPHVARRGILRCLHTFHYATELVLCARLHICTSMRMPMLVTSLIPTPISIPDTRPCLCTCTHIHISAYIHVYITHTCIHNAYTYTQVYM